MSFNITAAERHRATLGLGSRIGTAELKVAYYALVKQWHPDKFPNQTDEWVAANEKMAAINVAHEFLSEVLESIGGNYPASNQESRTHVDGPCSWEDLQPRHRYEGQPYGRGFPDHNVIEIFVRSSHIVSTGYQYRTRTLYIKFSGGGVYRYFDVPQSVFEAFLSADSHGRFAHRHIYNSFRYDRC